MHTAWQALKQRAVLATKKELQEQLRTTSWWLPQFQPEGVKDKIVQVSPSDPPIESVLWST